MSLVSDSATAVAEFEPDAGVSAWPIVCRSGEVRTTSARPAAADVAGRPPVPKIDFITSESFDRGYSVSVPVGLDDERLLSAKEEATLFRHMNFLKYRASELLEELGSDHARARQQGPIRELLAESIRIRNQLVHVFSKLAISIVRSFSGEPISYEELLSEAHAALLRAVEKFDADRGYRFSTYATHAVRRSLYRFVNNRSRDRARMVPTDSLEVVDERRRDDGYQRQLDQSVATLNLMMDRLEPREQFIIRSRFGLSDLPGEKTLQSLADELGLSRERVRQLECRAIQRLSEMAYREQLVFPGD